MKTVIAGSHGVGKSTLLENVEHANKLNEVARGLILELGKTPQEMNHEEKVNFQTEIRYRQMAQEKLYDNFISDRAIYDNLAYARETSERLFNRLVGKTKKQHDGYDKVYYIAPEFEIEDDGIRYVDPVFQKKIDQNILEIFDMLSVEYTQLTGSVEERIYQMKT